MAVVAAVVPATVLTAHRLVDSPGTPLTESTDLPIPPVSPSASRTPTAAPSATPSATPSKDPASSLVEVAPDAPRRISSRGVLDAGFDNAVTTFDAASTSEVARLESRGSPGSPGTDTVVVIGRVHADGDGAFGALPELKRGAKVSIRTDRGTMTYTVRTTALVAESALGHEQLIHEQVAGRLVLVGIRYDASGDRLGKALVVAAELSRATKA